MSRRRLFLILFVALGLSPGVFWRSNLPPADYRQAAAFRRLALPDMAARAVGGEGGPLLVDAWEISSNHADFGSYSALVSLENNDFLAISDKGKQLRWHMEGSRPRLLFLGGIAGNDSLAKFARDAEAATRDRDTGNIWVAYENRNAIIRYGPDFAVTGTAAPDAMRGWPFNAGPEAMVRLADGRFIVLSEGAQGWQAQSGDAVLFSSDPVAEQGAQTVHFRFPVPDGYRVTDMASLPDGKIIAVLRGFEMGLPPRFTAQLVIADPSTIRAGEEWQWEALGPIAPPIPLDNYEGLAITDEGHSTIGLWLISDDNDMGFQRSLLLKFEWHYPMDQAHEKTRGLPARSSNQIIRR